MAKTMMLSEVIKQLLSLQSQFGNLPVYMSSDSEGNSMGTLDKSSFTIPTVNSPAYVTLYPFEEYVDV